MADHEIDLSGTAHGQFKIARRILNMDELVRMQSTQPRFEKDIKMPGDSRGAANTVFLFSIDGVLDGKKIEGALFAGEAMLVQARTLKKAERIAREGLADTRKLAFEEHEDRLAVITPDGVIQAGATIEASGKRGQLSASEDPELLKSDPLMKKTLAHVIGKLPWKH